MEVITQSLTPADAAQQYRCPKHPEISLAPVLKGGAGYCSVCRFYVQAAGIPEPARDIPRPAKKRTATARAKKKAITRRGAASPALPRRRSTRRKKRNEEASK